MVALEEPFGEVDEGSYNILFGCHHWFEVASCTPGLWVSCGKFLEDWGEQCVGSSIGVPLGLVLNELTYGR